MRELPGRESRSDCAFFLGSSAGTLEEDDRELEIDVRAGRVREERAGRRRAAPTLCQSIESGRNCGISRKSICVTHLRRFLSVVLMPF